MKTTPKRRTSTVAGIVVVLTLVPLACFGQAPWAADSFGNLRRSLKLGQVVIVNDQAGRETRGKLAEVAETSIVILARDERGAAGVLRPLARHQGGCDCCWRAAGPRWTGCPRECTREQMQARMSALYRQYVLKEPPTLSIHGLKRRA